jgi:fucose permease
MLGIAFIGFLSLPLWKRVSIKKENTQSVALRTLTLKQMVKVPAIRTAVIMFFCSVSLEFTCGIWACTFLVNTQGLTEAMASRFLTFYYAGITIGRLVSGFISKFLHVEKIVYIGYSIVLIALIILFLPLAPIYKRLALFLIGFGNGPTFPNLTYITPENFGKDV